jgi:hypothetical protein
MLGVCTTSKLDIPLLGVASPVSLLYKSSNSESLARSENGNVHKMHALIR